MVSEAKTKRKRRMQSETWLYIWELPTSLWFYLNFYFGLLDTQMRVSELLNPSDVPPHGQSCQQHKQHSNSQRSTERSWTCWTTKTSELWAAIEGDRDSCGGALASGLRKILGPWQTQTQNAHSKHWHPDRQHLLLPLL